MARRALGLRARGVWRQAFEINGRPTTEPGLPARSFSPPHRRKSHQPPRPNWRAQKSLSARKSRPGRLGRLCQTLSRYSLSHEVRHRIEDGIGVEAGHHHGKP